MFIYPRLHLGPWFCCISKKTHNQTLKSSSEVTNESLGANQSLVHLVGALEQSFFLPSSLLDRMRKLAKQNKMSLCCLQGDSACRLWLLCAAGFPFFFLFFFFSCSSHGKDIQVCSRTLFFFFHSCSLSLVWAFGGVFNMLRGEKIIQRWAQRDHPEVWNYILDMVPSDFELTSCCDGDFLQLYSAALSYYLQY